jgi:hypothetical protein
MFYVYVLHSTKDNGFYRVKRLRLTRFSLRLLLALDLRLVRHA